jgi:hypothetical protein
MLETIFSVSQFQALAWMLMGMGVLRAADYLGRYL